MHHVWWEGVPPRGGLPSLLCALTRGAPHAHPQILRPGQSEWQFFDIKEEEHEHEHEGQGMENSGSPAHHIPADSSTGGGGGGGETAGACPLGA